MLKRDESETTPEDLERLKNFKRIVRFFGRIAVGATVLLCFYDWVDWSSLYRWSVQWLNESVQWLNDKTMKNSSTNQTYAAWILAATIFFAFCLRIERMIEEVMEELRSLRAILERNFED